MADSLNPKLTAFCETEVLLDFCAFTWTIKNFSYSCRSYEEHAFISPKFHSSRDKKCTWQLKLLPYHFNREKPMELHLLFPENIIYGVAKLTICDSEGKELCSEKRELSVSPDVGFGNCHICVLHSCPKKLPNDQMIITFAATTYYDQVNKFIETRHIESEVTSARLVRYISSLLKNDRLSDFTLKVGKKTFPAHRAILAANSSVFEAMFQNNMKESISAVVEITDFDAKTIEKLLCFMYTQKEPCFEDLKSAISLYEVADKYDVDDLKTLCKKYLISILDAGNAHDILLSGEKHNDLTLKEETLAFIQAHPEISVEAAAAEVVLGRPALLQRIGSFVNSRRSLFKIFKRR